MGPVRAGEAQPFGRYALVAKLATGGMAEIFLARLEGVGGFEKLVCVKRMLPQFVKDHSLVAMFLAEAKIAAQISHPNVCQVFELGEIDGRYFIAMEYLQGVPLSCFRRRDMYPVDPDPRLVAAIGVHACEGLHHAHNLAKPDGTLLEVVHRDVSTSNLFATVDGVVKVLDFGIAKVQDASVRTTTGSVKGTYAYMAPEQLRGERVDRRTDVFALGVVLWEVLARRHLFRRETDFLTFQAITTDPIPNICRVRPDVSAPLGAAIAKALSRDREERHTTARAFADALTAAVAPLGGPLSAPALADEIGKVFATALGEQRRLIQVAREGGAFDLDDDLGPSVGHGAELTVTPVSIVSSVDHRSAAPSVIAPIVPEPEPVRTGHSSARMAMVAALALAGGGIAAFVLLNGRAAPEVRDAPSVARATIQIDASPPLVDAEIAEEIPDAEVAAMAVVPPDAGTVKRPVIAKRRPPPAAPVDPCGPNAKGPISDECFNSTPVRGPAAGFITLDSSPAAMIFVDGAQLGKTPLAMLKLAPGKHTVRAVAPSGAEQTISITIASLKVAKARTFSW